MTIRLSDHFSYSRLLRFVLPTIVMMLVSSLYSIVDGFFVSNLVGKNAFAAVNLIMPVLMGLSSFGFLIGTGGSALVAKTFGEGAPRKANAYFTMLIGVLIVVGILSSLLGFAFMPQIAHALGARPAIFQDCVLYGRVLLLGNTFFMLHVTFLCFFVTAEKPKLGLLLSILAGITNIILDIVLIAVFPLGIWGAAIATLTSQVVGGVLPLFYFSSPKRSILHFVATKLDIRALGQACVNGSSEMLTTLSASLVGILYNIELLAIAAEDGIAAYGVIMYVNFIFMGIFIGYSLGSAPIISYHYGMQNAHELHNIFTKSMRLLFFASISMVLCGVGFSLPLAHLFVGYDTNLLALTAQGLQLYSLSFLLCGLNIFASSLFTALNNGLVSAIISFSRTLVLQVAAILILPIFFGIQGIWLAVFVAEGLTLLITICLLVRYRRRYHY